MNDDLTAREAAAILGLPVRSFYELGLPCYKYSPRRTRWPRAIVEEHKAKCLCTGIKPKAAGAILSTASLTADVTELQSSFRRAGVVVKPKPTTGRKADVYTLKSRDSKASA